MNLELKDLSIGYRRSAPICSGISATAHTADTIALIGGNGEGKTTLLRTIATILKPLGGEILIDGKGIHSISVERRASLVSIVTTEQIHTAYTTVKQLVSLGRVPYSNWAGALSGQDMEVVERAMELTSTLKLANHSLDALSDGQRQRVMIARALAQDTPIILLDEPTAFLDPKNRVKVIEMLRTLSTSEGKTIIYSTHEVDLALAHTSKSWEITEATLRVTCHK